MPILHKTLKPNSNRINTLKWRAKRAMMEILCRLCTLPIPDHKLGPKLGPKLGQCFILPSSLILSDLICIQIGLPSLISRQQGTYLAAE